MHVTYIAMTLMTCNLPQTSFKQSCTATLALNKQPWLNQGVGGIPTVPTSSQPGNLSISSINIGVPTSKEVIQTPRKVIWWGGRYLGISPLLRKLALLLSLEVPILAICKNAKSVSLFLWQHLLVALMFTIKLICCHMYTFTYIEWRGCHTDYVYFMYFCI